VLFWHGSSPACAERDELAWRKTRDPWSILVSETMLTQTSTARVAGVYPGFLARFATPASCSLAGAGEVIRAWSGLGYNRRALSLHRTAEILHRCYDGVVPAERKLLLRLPGVGEYIARAVQSFAFGLTEAPIDTNIARVLARAVAGEPLRAPRARRLADALLVEGDSRSWNLALMDLGAIHCRARRPSCRACPLGGAPPRAGTAVLCRFFAAGGDGPDPAVASAHVTAAQARFEGSDRQGRGRLVRCAREGPIPLERLAVLAGWPQDEARAGRVARQLVAEGMLVEADGALALPAPVPAPVPDPVPANRGGGLGGDRGDALLRAGESPRSGRG